MTRNRWARVGVVAVALVATSACAPLRLDVGVLSHDVLDGRDNDTPESQLAQSYLIARLQPFADGLVPGAVGDAAFRQTIPGGTNILAVIPGGDLADEYVLVGAHYDHVRNCARKVPADTICNGATDNAAGSAAVLAVGRAIAAQGTPRRSVILALWDREEDGLLGSAYYTSHPVVPLDQTVAYVNFDIQGANLLPSLRTSTVAVGAETGGPLLRQFVDGAALGGGLFTEHLSAIFGQYRSDYINFINVGVPSVFFTDSTGPCYHTSSDEFGVVDFDKLRAQVRTARRLVSRLASRDVVPAFAPGTPPATYDDAVALDRLAQRGSADLDRFAPADRAVMERWRDNVAAIVAAGPDAFGSDDQTQTLADTAAVVSLLTRGECDGFLTPAG